MRKKRRRRRGEEEWLRFHYILYMSKMPGRLLPASLSAPCWMCVCTCTHSSVVFTLSLTFSCRKKNNYLSGFRVSKMDLSHRVARGRSHEPQLHRETRRRKKEWKEKKKKKKKGSPTCVSYIYSHLHPALFSGHVTFMAMNANELNSLELRGGERMMQLKITKQTGREKRTP